MSILFLTFIAGLPLLLSWPLSRAMVWAIQPAEPIGGIRRNIELFLRKVGGPAVSAAQQWKSYALSLLLFNAGMFVIVHALLSLQTLLPLNPDAKGALAPSLIFHTAASFVTNTNLQHYSGEVSMSYFSQLFGLMWLQFVSAATGIAALTALARGLAREPVLGNFYRDLMRATFLILLPLATGLALLLVLGGVPMTLQGAAVAKTLEGAMQTITRGPVAALEAIKQLGTNGGGFFGPNAAHPFENPSFFTNIIECVAIVLIPMASVWMFGRITGRGRHAVVLFAVMALLLTAKGGFPGRQAADP
jgi:K+-transporting ATPase ATPase A chain